MTNPHLLVNKYFVDGEEAHIVLLENPDHELFLLLERICPASLYRHDDKGYYYDYTGCLECGSCAVIGGDAVFRSWSYPRGGYGIDYGAR